MKTVFGLVRVLVLTACLPGCRTDAQVTDAQVTEPVAVGPDTFTLSSRTSTGGIAPARDAAVTAANQQCTRLSKQLLLVSSDASFGSSPDKGVVTIKFRCVTSDVQSIRPKVQ
jgi:hypothetical protein